mgnify:CR=1 FL=1|jgi:hypothetical protein
MTFYYIGQEMYCIVLYWFRVENLQSSVTLVFQGDYYSM